MMVSMISGMMRTSTICTPISPNFSAIVCVAAMDTVSEFDMGVAMANAGGVAVIHRNMGDNNQQADIVKRLSDAGHKTSAAIGSSEGQLERAKSLIDAGVDMIVIDTAHGHSMNVLKQVEAVRKLSSNVTLCAGNIATAKAAQALIDAGVDVLKVGIGPGSICTTRIVAGVGVPQLTAVMNVMPARAEFVKISNAGLKESHVHDLASMQSAPNYGG